MIKTPSPYQYNQNQNTILFLFTVGNICLILSFLYLFLAFGKDNKCLSLYEPVEIKDSANRSM